MFLVLPTRLPNLYLKVRSGMNSCSLKLCKPKNLYPKQLQGKFFSGQGHECCELPGGKAQYMGHSSPYTITMDVTTRFLLFTQTLCLIHISIGINKNLLL